MRRASAPAGSHQQVKKLVKKLVFEAIAASVARTDDTWEFQEQLKQELEDRSLLDVSLHEVYYAVKNVLENLVEDGHTC